MPRTKSLRNVVRIACLILLGSPVVGLAAGIKSERLLAAILSQTPASILVTAGQQWQRAEAAAAGIQGATAFWGVGESMEPLFPHQTAIVVAPIPFSELKRGMTVLYVTHAGYMVAHSLTGDVPSGWIAQGINNDEEDEDLVTRDNLVGVIVEAYSEISSMRRAALVNHLVLHGRLARAGS